MNRRQRQKKEEKERKSKEPWWIEEKWKQNNQIKIGNE